jgi:hypothetical protein
MHKDWRDISYLRSGTERQRAVYGVLHESAVLEVLSGFDPVLVGTFPLDLDVPGSDLDIVCYAKEPDVFGERVREAYGHLTDFSVRHKRIKNRDSVIARFSFGGFPFEIFGQPIPVSDQDAYRHMVAEYRLLQLGGDNLRRMVRGLKLQGAKTEPAFAQALQLEGDPFDLLLEMYDAEEGQLKRLVSPHKAP